MNMTATTPAPSAMTADLIDALQRLCTHEKRTSAQIDADWDYARAVLARASQPVAAAPAIKKWQERATFLPPLHKPSTPVEQAMASEIADLHAALQQRQAPAQADLDQRAIGRAEAMAILIGLSAEDGLDDCIGSHQVGFDGEWDAHWKDDKLRALFRVDDAAWSLVQEGLAKADELRWEQSLRNMDSEFFGGSAQQAEAAPVASAEPIYQFSAFGGKNWSDCAKEFYNDCPQYNYQRRIVYTAPVAQAAPAPADEARNAVLEEAAMICESEDQKYEIGRSCAVAIRALKSDAAPAPTAEPMAWLVLDCMHLKPCSVTLDKDEVDDINPPHVLPLYATPSPHPVSIGVEPLDADEMIRLRRLMAALGMDGSFNASDEYVRGILCTVLGQAAGKIERAAHPSAEGGAAEASTLHTWPAEIYLSTGEDDELLPFDSYHEVSWCDHPTNSVDVRYVRADLAATPSTQQETDK